MAVDGDYVRVAVILKERWVSGGEQPGSGGRGGRNLAVT